MIYDVRLSRQAENDLRNIFEYITYELLAPENASGQLAPLEEQNYKLDEMPYRYPAYKKNRGSPADCGSSRWITT